MENENKIFNSLFDVADYIKDYPTIMECFLKADYVLAKFNNPCCYISGGKDSDIMLDIISKVDKDKKVQYVWFDTGIEYQATKDHLNYLEQRYCISIHREKAIKAIPTSCREYGQPFLSKHVSDKMSSLQSHNFQWEDESFDTLIQRYPKCRSALLWWTNGKANTHQYNISGNKYLKEFILQNPPQFKISNKCCNYAKKSVAHKFEKEHKCDLSIIGVRKAEGGIRATAYKSCFSENEDKISQYRPIFWFKEEDKDNYDKLFNIRHSNCYEVYGLKRTGCVGCPYTRDIDKDIAVMEEYEPKLAKAAHHIFKESYEYTKLYRQFVDNMKTEKKLK